MKKTNHFFVAIKYHSNINKLKAENVQLKEKIEQLEKEITILQTEKQLNHSVQTEKLDFITHNIKKQSKELNIIAQKMDILCPSDNNIASKNDKKNVIATTIAILVTFAVMIFNIIGIAKMDIWKATENVGVIICKMLELLISTEIIFHMRLLAQLDKHKPYFWGNRIFCFILVIGCAFTQSFSTNYDTLSNANSILSYIAFIVAFSGNYIDYIHPPKSNNHLYINH